jgi:hypothetical protein
VYRARDRRDVTVELGVCGGLGPYEVLTLLEAGLDQEVSA